MSSVNPPTYLPYQAYKSKRHSRTVSTPPVDANGQTSPSPAPPAQHTPTNSVDFTQKAPPKRKLSLGDNRRQSLGAASLNGLDASILASGPESPTARSRPKSMILPRAQEAPLSTTNGVKESYEVVVPVAAKDPSPANSALPEKNNATVAEPTSPTAASDVKQPALIQEKPTVPSQDAKEAAPTIHTPIVNVNGAPASEAGPSTQPAKHPYSPRKSSTFRRVPLRAPSSAANTSIPRTSSPLRPPGTQTHSRSASSSTFSSPLIAAQQPEDTVQSIETVVENFEKRGTPAASASPGSRSLGLVSSFQFPAVGPDSPSALSPSGQAHQRATSMNGVPSGFSPPQRTSSLSVTSIAPPIAPPKASSPSPAPSVPTSPSPRVQSPFPVRTPTTSSSTYASASGTLTPTSAIASTSTAFRTAYRPGFQPKGVYRPLTDEFLGARKAVRDASRVELTRLERRLEKLIELHFSQPGASNSEKAGAADANGAKGKVREKEKQPSLTRRASSFFEDLGELRTKSASELWRGVLESRTAAVSGGKNDIRAAEQRITPWQEDSEVSACPLCNASFHPLTNRKHHCRLCGKIMCSLPVKKPQRPQPCSLLFIADPKTGRIEEVSEGVDYGVRPRMRSDAASVGGKGKGGEDVEKFLKGVRVCRECKPVMLRQQYRHEAKRVPSMIKLYDALLALEAEIEECLPQFQELMQSLNDTEDAPTKEASAARKHLLQCFSDYDAIAKRIRKIPCPGGSGGSQDRVQTAIMTRATVFLQKNMFPLQSLPKFKKRRPNAPDSSVSPAPSSEDGSTPTPSSLVDLDSELAKALQPLLEQEALLEGFVEEATAARKFEDAKTLMRSLGEIRSEIERVVGGGV